MRPPLSERVAGERRTPHAFTLRPSTLLMLRFTAALLRVSMSGLVEKILRRACAREILKTSEKETTPEVLAAARRVAEESQ